MTEFVDRSEAGRRLAARLRSLGLAEGVVLGLPRGGVPVAAEVARSLALPFDVVVVRKVGLPTHPELAMGAVGESGTVVKNADIIRFYDVSEEEFSAVVEKEQRELERRAALWRSVDRVDLADQVAILVDDGIATGATVRTACAVVRRLGARRVLVAAPVAPRELRAADLGTDDLVVVVAPRRLVAVGRHYDDFTQTTDAEVTAALGR